MTKPHPDHMNKLKPNNTSHNIDDPPLHLETSNLFSTAGESCNPQSWPKWKREAQIWIISIHSMISTFMAAGIIPAYESMAEEYGVTVHKTSYLSSSQILLLGVAPLLWGPISSRYGRYHLCLVSVFASMLLNIGGARCTTFASQLATRVLTAFFISPPIGIGGGIITELAPPEHRAEKLGYWTLLTVLGTPAGPLIMGFVVQHAGVSWVYWIYAILNFSQLLVYLSLGAETRYIENEDPEAADQAQSPSLARRLLPQRIDTTPLSISDFLGPLVLAKYPRVLIPALAHAIIFCYGNIAIVVEMPIAVGEKFGLNAQQTGLQFISVIIGSVLGEQLSGPLSDYFLSTLRKRRANVCPADRLWLFYVGFATVIAGLLTWGFQLQHASTTWNVTPCVGAAIAAFGNQIQTTILLAFAVDSHRTYSGQIGVFINLCRLAYGFTGPFYFPPMFSSLGLGGAAGVMCAIMVVGALIPTIAIQVAATRAAH
ncbi:MFS general substrate transporter [Aspergillus pseudocaelatus]|uniref:MFS general substrate transporter n=1 Tax=Aspergillus pseudocaelatus TaxID=1825620 RepID=A0ABQ6WUJ4_9EURO|nr:MFS general substrate transporter [Aspergillus pseudocaelatus]